MPATKKVDWVYRRNGCVSCKRADSFLADHGIAGRAIRDARKEPVGWDEAQALVAEASKLFVAKGKKYVQVDLKKSPPDAEELRKLIIGPTGNLRAPTIRRGKTLLVGFNEEMYDQVLG
ncbi:MAG: hypothetical protein KatS3mg111_1208 [Pirellulaceae bacterium]|nr:MAG: hypothetical protein KatS3mg111_1208 [Pirellulaceae bacterium]